MLYSLLFFLMAFLPASAGQMLALTNTDGTTKNFYVVGCTYNAVICKYSAADKQTFKIPFEQLDSASTPQVLYELAKQARKLAIRLVTGDDPDIRKKAPKETVVVVKDEFFGERRTLVQSYDAQTYMEEKLKNDNFENEQDVTFLLRGKIQLVADGSVLNGILTDLNNDKTRRIIYSRSDSRRFDNKTEIRGTFKVYNFFGRVGETVTSLSVYSTMRKGEYVLAGDCVNALEACESVIVPPGDAL